MPTFEITKARGENCLGSEGVHTLCVALMEHPTLEDCQFVQICRARQRWCQSCETTVLVVPFKVRLGLPKDE